MITLSSIVAISKLTIISLSVAAVAIIAVLILKKK